MSYICTNWQAYEHGSKHFSGNGQCVVFVQHVTGAPNDHEWRPGLKVLGNGHLIPQGTAIATFNSEGKYPNMSSGNHAALFVSEDGHSIKVIDQYHGKHSHHPGPSTYSHLGAGNDTNMTGDPDFYYVVESH
jgi:hypothetical protein